MELKELGTDKELFRKTLLAFAKDLDTDAEMTDEKQFIKAFNKNLKKLETIYKDVKEVKLKSGLRMHNIAALVQPRAQYINNIITEVNFDTLYEQEIVTDHVNIMIRDLER